MPARVGHRLLFSGPVASSYLLFCSCLGPPGRLPHEPHSTSNTRTWWTIVSLIRHVQGLSLATSSCLLQRSLPNSIAPPSLRKHAMSLVREEGGPTSTICQNFDDNILLGQAPNTREPTGTSTCSFSYSRTLRTSPDKSFYHQRCRLAMTVL